MALQVNIHEAKTNLSRLLARVREGEEIIIAKAGKPIARLVPVGERPVQRLLGVPKARWPSPLILMLHCLKLCLRSLRDETPTGHPHVSVVDHR